MSADIVTLHTTHTDTPGRERLCALPEFANFPTLGFTPPNTDAAGVTRQSCKICIAISAILRNRDAEARRRTEANQPPANVQERLL